MDRSILIFNSRVRSSNGNTVVRRVSVHPDSGHVGLDIYTIGPRGGLGTGAGFGFSSAEFKLIAERVAEVEANPAITRYNDVEG